jgi:hypothetical protein
MTKQLRLRSRDRSIGTSTELTALAGSWPGSLLLETGLSLAVCFPEVEDGTTVRAASSTGPKRLGVRETILLVEDEDAVRRIVCTILQRHGYEVLDAPTPRRACELFAEHGPKIDLLLTDVVMPEMNGPSLAERLVAKRRDLRVLFMSGYVGLAAPFMGTDPAMISLLNKPFQSSTLLAKVHEVLTSPRMTP